MRLTALAVFVSLIAACGTKPNPAVCCISQADCTSLGIDEPVRNCQGGLVCVDHGCVAPECEVDQDCGDDTPFCSEQTCVGCRDDGDCAASAPVCDSAVHECRSCATDSECASQACDFETGACIDTSSVLYASPTGSDQAECSQQQPCSITRAVSAASATRFTVKLIAGVYNANLSISRKLEIHGDGATVIAGASDTTLYVVDGARVRIYGLSVVNNNISGGAQALLGFICQSNDGINVPELFFDRVVVETLKQPGSISACRLAVSRSTLKSPRNQLDHYTFVTAPEGVASFDRSMFIGGGSIGAFGGHITIANSVFDELLGEAQVGALGTTAGGSISVSFSTIFNSPMACGGTDVPACASASRVGVCIDNSIINKPSSLADSLSGMNCRVSYSIVSPQQGSVPGDNNMVGAAPSFKDPANRDFHLNADSPAVDAANPSAVGTPDYDGTMRPQGGRSDIGAFEFKP